MIKLACCDASRRNFFDISRDFLKPYSVNSFAALLNNSHYSFELFYFYNVQKIIRIGTCGVLSPEVDIPEIILADKIFTEANFGFSYNGYKGNTVVPSMNLVNHIYEVAKEKKLNVHKGAIMTTDVFGPYVDDEAILNRVPKDIKPLGEEMEGFALVLVANSFNREAAVIATATDSPYSNKVVTADRRQTSLNVMISLALDSLI